MEFFDRLNGSTQEIVGRCTAQMYLTLREQGVYIAPDAHVRAVSEAIARWIVECGNTDRLRKQPHAPAVDEGTAVDIMEWWRLRHMDNPDPAWVSVHSSDPNADYNGAHPLSLEEGDFS